MPEAIPAHVEPKVEPKAYGPLGAGIVTLLIFFLGQLLGGLLIGIVPGVLGWDSNRAELWFKESTVSVFLTVLAVEAITLLLLFYFIKRRKLSWASIGFNRLKANHFGYALVGFGLYFLIYIAALIAVSIVLPNLNLKQEQDLGFNTAASGSALILIFISLVILPPLIEELLMRGFLYTGLRSRLTYVQATLITSLLFAAAHLPAAKEGLLWIGALDTFILSLILCHLREKTGSLWPSIGVHAIKNGVAFTILFGVLQR